MTACGCGTCLIKQERDALRIEVEDYRQQVAALHASIVRGGEALREARSLSYAADMNRKETLDAAAACVLKDRQATHGRPENTFSAIAGLWSAYLSDLAGTPIRVRPHDVCAMLVLLKVGRISQNPSHEDNWVDTAGYAACGAELSSIRPAPEMIVTPANAS